MADVSQIKLPNGSVYDLIDEKSGYITAEYIEDKTDYEIPVSRVGEIVVGETVIGTDSTNFPTSKAVVDYVDERLVQEIAAIDFEPGITGIEANGTSLSVENGVVNIPAFSSNQSIGLMTEEYMINIWNGIDNVSDLIPTTTSELYNDSGFITLETDPTVPDWAKAPTKPTYTASEVGALPDSTFVPHIFKVNYNPSTNTADKTYTEIGQAYGRGDLVLLKDNNSDIYQITNYGSGYIFTTVDNLTHLTPTEGLNAKIKQLKVASDNTWSTTDYKLPRKTSDLTNDSGYLTASDIASVMTYKGTKANYAALPASGNTTGDVWHLTDTGAEWAWDGSTWQELGTAIDLSGYATKATTLAGYGITDAKIQNGTITLGSNTITPLTSFTETDPTVPSWAKASSKPSYSLTEISGTDDLRVIEGLTGTTGLLKKTAANTWTLDTNTYLTSYTETDPTVPSWAKASSKPSYGLTEISGTDDLRAIEALTGTSGFLKKTAANTWTLDTNTYLTSYTETDPTVPSWAKQSSKPTYTAAEVGALPDSTTIPSKVSDLTNDSGFISSYTETDPVFSASAAAGITSTDISNWNAKTSNTGTVTSVRVQATSPVQSSTSTAQSASLNTTISLADAYGDTKNPYGSKTKNYVLAAPSTAAGVPSFRALVSADIPDLSSIYLPLTGGQVTGPVSFGDSVSIDEATIGDLVVNGSASFTNNISANTINGVAVGNSPKFTDTVTTISTSGSGNAITAISASNGVLTATKGTTFLTSYTETDPVFSASAAAGITATDISNWNNKSSTDEKLKLESIGENVSYYPILTTGNMISNASTKFADLYGISYSGGSGIGGLILGNNTSTTESTGRQGRLTIYSTGTFFSRFITDTLTANSVLTLPNKTGTVALTSDIPKVYSSTNTSGYLTMATLPIYDGTVE